MCVCVCVCVCVRHTERERENEQMLYWTRLSAHVKERERECVCAHAHTHTHTHTWVPEKNEGTSTKQNLPEFSSQLYLVTMQNKQNQGTKIHWRWLHIVTKKGGGKRRKKKDWTVLASEHCHPSYWVTLNQDEERSYCTSTLYTNSYHNDENNNNDEDDKNMMKDIMILCAKWQGKKHTIINNGKRTISWNNK